MTFHSGEAYTDSDICIAAPDVLAIRQSIILEDVASSIVSWLEAGEHRDDVYYFSIYHDRTLIGQILLHDIDEQARTSLVAYHLFEPSYRGRGIGTRALQLFVRFVSEHTNLSSLVIITSNDNIASQRIAQKCGFVHVGVPREHPRDGLVFRWHRPEVSAP